MLNPFLLWFLPLAAIPILLHLITLYRLRTVDLSTFRFLMDSYVQQRRKLKLLEWLLMILRTAFVALIVMMLARPMVDKLGYLFGGPTGRDVVVIVDAGATMALKSQATTALQRAREAARAVVGKLSPADHVKIIRAGHHPAVLFDGFAAKPQAALEVLDKIEPDITPADLGAALVEALSGNPHGPRVVYLLSDTQQQTFATIRQHSGLKQLDAELNVVVMNVGTENPVTNLGIIGDPPRTSRPVAGLPVLLTATVAAGPNEKPVDTRLTIVLDEQQVGQMSLSLQPGQTVTRAIGLTPTRAGILKGRFELTGDDFTEDDKYLFTLNVEPRINVVLVTGPQPGKPVEDPRLFIQAAMRSPLLAQGSKESEEKRIAQSLAISAIVQEQLNDQALRDADVVIAANVQMDPNRAKWLLDYVRGGGGLLLFPGPHIEPNHYTQFFFAATRPEKGKQPLLRFEKPVGDTDNETTFQPITSVDLTHPVLAAFADEEHEYFSTSRLYRYWPVALSDDPEVPAGAAAVLMRNAKREPVLVEARIGQGRLMVASFAATPELSNLPLKGEFVPMLLRSTAYLRRDAQVNAVSAVRPHEPARIQLSERWNGAGVEVVDPAGHPRAIEMHPSERSVVGAMSETDKKGYYTFNVQPPASSGGKLTGQQMGFAVNLDAEQIRFDPMKREQVETLFTPAKVTYLAGSPDDPVLSAQLSNKREIWRSLIVAMFLIIGVEFLLSTLKPSGPGKPATGFGGRLRQMTGQIDRAVGLAETAEK